MALAVIDINDSGIEIGIDGKWISTSPGVAVLDGTTLLVGEEAARHARLLPRWTNNRFWNQLSTDALPQGSGNVRHHADLAFAHLESIWLPIKDQVDRVIFLVPAFYEQTQLGLLLGMAKECNIPVAGVADSSVVTAARHASHDQILHLDVHLHRITLTNLSLGTLLSRRDHQTVAETGLFTFWDRWANIIAKQFIQTSRFDPMHEASSEQALFNQLPDWIAQQPHGNTFELALPSGSYSVAVSQDQLMQACSPIYPQLVQAIRNLATGQATLLLSHRFRGFPGIKDSLGLINTVELVESEPGQAIQTAFEMADAIVPGNGNITHVTNLAVNKRTPVTAADDRKVQRASHLLMGNHAVAVGKSYFLSSDFGNGITQDMDDPVCVFYNRGNDIMIEPRAGHQVSVNGELLVDAIKVLPGDAVNHGDHALTVISVSG